MIADPPTHLEDPMPKAKDPKTGKFIYAAPKAKPLPAPGAVEQASTEAKQETTRRLTVEIPASLHKTLRVSAATVDSSLTDYVIRTLTKGLAAP